MFLDESYKIEIDPTAKVDLINELKEKIGVDTPAYVFAHKLAKSFKLQARVVAALLKQAIWTRQIRVDLFQPVLMDKPLQPEIQDVLMHYASWFRRWLVDEFTRGMTALRCPRPVTASGSLLHLNPLPAMTADEKTMVANMESPQAPVNDCFQESGRWLWPVWR